MQTTRTIESIYTRQDAMSEALSRFRAGNDSGAGFAWDGAPEGAAVVLEADSDTEVEVYRMPDGSEVAVGDVHGPWAVTITPAGSAR